MPPLDPVPDIEERAAIVQYDGGLSRREAGRRGLEALRTIVRCWPTTLSLGG